MITTPRTLTIKIALVVLAVSLFSVGLVALFSGWLTVREYDRLLLDQVQDNLVQQAAAYYAQAGSWEGALVAFSDDDDHRPRRQLGRMGEDARTPLVLLDANGCVIGPTDAKYTAGECLSAREMTAAIKNRLAARFPACKFAVHCDPAVAKIACHPVVRSAG